MISDDATSRAQSGAGAEAGGDGLGWDGFAAETGIKFFLLAVRGPGLDLVWSHTVVAGMRRGGAGGWRGSGTGRAEEPLGSQTRSCCHDCLATRS